MIQFIRQQYNYSITIEAAKQNPEVEARIRKLVGRNDRQITDNTYLMLLIDVFVTKNKKKFDWEQAAQNVDHYLSKQKLYHFYFETFQKRIFPSISDDDKLKIKWYLEDAYVHEQPINEKLKNAIKATMQEVYHFSIFNVYYNNQKRSITKLSRKKVLKAHIKLTEELDKQQIYVQTFYPQQIDENKLQNESSKSDKHGKHDKNSKHSKHSKQNKDSKIQNQNNNITNQQQIQIPYQNIQQNNNEQQRLIDKDQLAKLIEMY